MVARASEPWHTPVIETVEPTLPANYPSRWEADVVLSDGGTVHVRPIRPDDAERLVAFHNRQSQESIYYRFFSAHPRLSAREVRYFTEIDYHDRLAFIALLGDEMVAVARYEPTGRPGVAEAAFIVDDAHHGRGLATLLLEYLVVAAREAGYDTLTATILPGNTAMLTTFRRAGFENETRWAEGLVEVSIDLCGSTGAEALIAERERRADARSVARLLRPGSVAVVGASRDPESAGNRVLVNLLEGGFEGPVFPVNDQADHIHSVPAYRTLHDVPSRIDLAVVAVPGDRLDGVIDDCALLGVGGMVVLATGVDGGLLAARVRGRGMRMVGPASLGVVNDDPERSLWAIIGPPPALLGGVRGARHPGQAGAALSVQSASLGAAVLELAAQASLPLTSFVSLGDKADVSGNDLLQYWDDDPTTAVVLLYLESYGNPRRFFRIARRVSRRKPIVAVSTAGWSDGEGTFGGRSGLFSALLAQAGVIEATTLGELVDVGRLLASQPLPVGPRLAVVSNTVSPATLAAAAGRRGGLEPVDVVTLDLDAGPLDFQEQLTLVLGRPGVDAVAVLFAPLRYNVDEVADAVAVAAGRSDKPVVACYLGRRQPSPGPVPAYRFPEDGVRALARAAVYGSWRKRQAEQAEAELAHTELAAEPSGDGQPGPVPGIDVDRVRAVIAQALGQHPEGVQLEGPEAADLLGAAHVEVAAQRRVSSPDEAVEAAQQIGWPVALKAGTRPAVARTEATGLALDLVGPEELRAAWDRMVEALGPAAMTGSLVQAMAAPGVDARVVALAHPHLGPVIALGRGGVAGSRPDELAVRLVPLEDGEPGRLIDASPLPIEALPLGGRAVLEDVLRRLGDLVADTSEIAELILDPVLVSNHSATVTDLKVRVAPPPPSPVPAVRRLE
ncbi:MAG: hypothetical protein QOJ19_2703 [Acidimicrobiia bacterium]|nr:hypothetical protein [Acidimicrobiia bacterium]